MMQLYKSTYGITSLYKLTKAGFDAEQFKKRTLTFDPLFAHLHTCIFSYKTHPQRNTIVHVKINKTLG